MKHLFIFILGFLFYLNSYSQKDTVCIHDVKLSSHPYYIGAAAGFTNGIGFSYIYWPKSYGIQVTALPTYIDGDFNYSAGLTLLKELSASKRTRLYLFFGNQITNMSHGSSGFNYNIGIGPGIEQGNDFFKFHLRIGYALYLNHYKSDYNESTNNDFSLLPTLELGWFYNFGNKK
jgi:hypothetical protein